MQIRHRAILFVLCSCWLGAYARADAGFGLEDVARKAEKLAQQPFQQPGPEVPRWLLDISYDQWRDIRFKPERALWQEAGSRFQVQLFHPGLFYDRVVKIHTIDAQGVRPLEFSPSQFDYGGNDFASRVPQDLGYAGFRLHYPIKTSDYLDEVIVFLGASYFRAVGKEQGFGLSARGLAVDTAAPSGEEFPFFREFWLVRPSPQSTEMEVLALLDSRRITGAYHFIIRPGDQTVVTVEARLFPRSAIDKVGIAPLTSMFFHGENTTRHFDDFRPEVHDSDGLLIEDSTGEWLWRPLDNPERLQVHAFQSANPRGFGLVQRDRDFESYQDLETRQDRRPSSWIAPKGDWGEGHVELVEIPTTGDGHDNVVAYWVPKAPVGPAQPIRLAYDMHWYGSDSKRPPAGYAIATRRDRTSEDVFRFVVDFAGKKLKRIPAERVLRAVISIEGRDSGSASLVDQQVIKSPVDGSWRLVFRIRRETAGPVELRASLDQGGDTLTETWTYSLEP